MSEFITRTPVQHGNADGTKLLLSPGDPISADQLGENGEELLAEMRADGRVVPAEVWSGLVDALDAQAKAKEAEAKAQAELAAYQASPSAPANFENSVAHAEFMKRVERDNAKVAERDKDTKLDPVTGQVKSDSVTALVTGSTPSPGTSSGSAQEVSAREAASVQEALDIQERKKEQAKATDMSANKPATSK